MNLEASIEPKGIISPLVLEYLPQVDNKCKHCNSSNIVIKPSGLFRGYLTCINCNMTEILW